MHMGFLSHREGNRPVGRPKLGGMITLKWLLEK
jgi:hypothetical protein